MDTLQSIHSEGRYRQYSAGSNFNAMACSLRHQRSPKLYMAAKLSSSSYLDTKLPFASNTCRYRPLKLSIYSWASRLCLNAVYWHRDIFAKASRLYPAFASKHTGIAKPSYGTAAYIHRLFNTSYLSSKHSHESFIDSEAHRYSPLPITFTHRRLHKLCCSASLVNETQRKRMGK